LEEPRIGVYICHCGGNISDNVDVLKVKEATTKLGGVKVVETYDFVCSDPGQEMILNGIKEHGLNRIVVASCSPRMHLDTFRGNLNTAGLNPYLFEIVNIREQCSWVHDEGTSKAIDLVRGAVERARFLEPLETKCMPVKMDVLIIGGGISGIISSLELANKGHRVYLVERGPSIGGHMAQLSKTYPTLDCSQCILTPKMVSAEKHPNIEIISMAKPLVVDGSPGNYRVLVRKRPRFVDSSKCTACGECEKFCPVEVPNEFETGLLPRKAIYTPFKQAIPRTYVIDKENCLFFKEGVCRLCEKFCKCNAVDFDQEEETVELDVGAIIACTGFQQIDANKLEEYRYGLHPDIVTNLQFERLIEKGVRRPSNGEMPKKVAFILCAGSRLINTDRGVEHCCKIGCMVAIKQAMLLQKYVPDVESCIFYTDIRADGKGCEEFYNIAQNQKVRFIRGKVARVLPSGETLTVNAEDTLLGKFVKEDFDLVVLSTGIIPCNDTEKFARILGIQVGTDGFLMERHYKLRPVDSQREGIFLSGGALGPKDVKETTLESMATASRVSSFLGKGEISTSPEIAYIIPDACNNCEECVKICPISAVETSTTSVTINPVSCVGCGICVPKCPKKAIRLNNSTEKQLLAQIHGICEGGKHPKIIAFLEKDIAYASADLAGQTRSAYPSNIEIISVPSIGRIDVNHVLHAFASGADGIIFIEGEGSVFKNEDVRKHVMQLKKQLKEYGVKPLRLVSITTTLPEYKKILNVFKMFNIRISKFGILTQEKRVTLSKNLDMKTNS